MSKIYKNETVEKNHFEELTWQKGKDIGGIDEAGRGPLFGPVVIAGTILPRHQTPEFLQDSKILTEKKRNYAYEWIMQNTLSTLHIIDAATIDTINIYQATKTGMRQVYTQLNYLYHARTGRRLQALTVDAMPLDCGPHVAIASLIKGERYSSSIAAASIVAKVTRDRLLQRYHAIFPHYQLNKHKGYGTAIHRDALIAHGPSLLHRTTFLTKILNDENNHLPISHKEASL